MLNHVYCCSNLFLRKINKVKDIYYESTPRVHNSTLKICILTKSIKLYCVEWLMWFLWLTNILQFDFRIASCTIIITIICLSTLATLNI